MEGISTAVDVRGLGLLKANDTAPVSDSAVPRAADESQTGGGQPGTRAASLPTWWLVFLNVYNIPCAFPQRRPISFCLLNSIDTGLGNRFIAAQIRGKGGLHVVQVCRLGVLKTILMKMHHTDRGLWRRPHRNALFPKGPRDRRPRWARGISGQHHAVCESPDACQHGDRLVVRRWLLRQAWRRLWYRAAAAIHRCRSYNGCGVGRLLRRR